MINSPLVSILMTVYNREKYIAEAIESVINSTYQNWELIIVDDQSKDRSVEIARTFENEDSRIKVYVNEFNLGDYPNRNKAASYAKGKYLKYLDADDMIYKYSISYMVDSMENFDGVAFGISYNSIDDIRPYPQFVNSDEAIRLEFLEKSVLGCGPSASIISKRIFDLEGGFMTAQFLGDQELWLRFASKYSIVKLQPSLVWWRQHPDQQTNLESRDDVALSKRFCIRKNYLQKNRIRFSKDEYDYAEKKLYQNHARLLLRNALKRKSLKYLLLHKRISGFSFCQLLSGFKKYY